MRRSVAGRQRDRIYYIAGTHPETTSRHTELVLKLVTYEPWEEVGSVGTFVGFEFDLNGDGRLDRCLKVRADGTLKAQMYEDSFGCAIEVEESKIGTRTATRSVTTGAALRDVRRLHEVGQAPVLSPP